MKKYILDFINFTVGSVVGSVATYVFLMRLMKKHIEEFEKTHKSIFEQEESV